MLAAYAHAAAPTLAAVEAVLEALFAPPAPGSHVDAPRDDGTGTGGTVVSLSLYDLCRDADVADATLRVTLALLDVTYGLVRELTPWYAQRKIEPAADGWSLAAEAAAPGASPAVKALAAHADAKKRWTYVDVRAAARATGMTPQALAAAMDGLVAEGKCAGGDGTKLRARFQLAAEVPSPARRAEVAAELHAALAAREAAEVARLGDVFDVLAGNQGCLPAALRRRNGDADLEDGWTCGACSACTAGPQELPRTAADTSSAARTRFAEAVASAGVPLDDVRLVARFGVGIASPRILGLKLTRAPGYGMLAGYDWEVVLAWAEGVRHAVSVS